MAARFHERRTPPWQLLAALALLLVLLAILATLQYRWLGEVSEAERTRMRESLRTAASEFAREFDRELTRTYAAFRVTSDQLDGNEAAALDAAYARWRSAAAAPQLLEGVYVAEGATFASARLRRLDPARHTLDDVAWPPALADALARTGRTLPRIVGAPPGPPPILLADAVDSRIPALLIPVTRLSHTTTASGETMFVADPGGVGRVVIVLLDSDQMRRRLVEPLAAKHFGGAESSEYMVTIARRDDPATVVYNSGPATIDAASADVTTGMFDLRGDEFDQLGDRFTLPVPPPGATRFAVTIVRKANGDSRHLIASGPDEQGAWQVRARHRAGSLDALVARSRRRNLAIGLGVLALLAASFVLVIASAQRQQRLARQQIEFVAAVSHELRTPLAVICSAGENLADGVVADGAQVKRYGTLIQTEGRRLADMVERVLQFAGITSGTTTRADADVNLGVVIADASAAMAADAHDRGVTITVSSPDALPAVAGDADALRSAIQNIVGNAVKYSHAGGLVDVSTEVLHDRRILRIRVVDRGIGIDAADLPHVFEPFYRGRSAVDAQVRGTGVGLSVVQHVIQTHGGDVHVESRLGTGTTVTVVLPATSASDTADGRVRSAVRLRRGSASAAS